MNTIIICNGSIKDYEYYSKYFDSCECVICADGGAHHARKFGIVPDLLIGDFDSIQTDDLQYFKDLGVEILEYPKEKDMTDTELAVDIAISKGYDEIVFIGALGARVDHSISNIFMLKSILDKGARGLIVDENNKITLIKRSVRMHKEGDCKLSLLPLSQKVEGVTTKGLRYPLVNETIHIGSSLGVSNEFVSDTAEVVITTGHLLVIMARD